MKKFFFTFFIILTFYIVQALDEKENNDFTEEKEFIEKEIDYTFKVQSISKYSKSIIDSPAFISLIFPFELKFFYHVNIGDLLNFSPGLYVVEDGAYWYLGSKGVQLPDGYNSRTLFLFDGLPINEVILGNVINYSPFFLNSLEIVHGYSNVYSGSNSLLGTINFIPYFEEDDNIRNEMSRTTYFMGNSKGSDNFLKARFVKLNNIKLDFGLNLGSYNGRDIFLPQRNELSIKDDNRYYKFYYLFGNYEKLNSKTSFYFSHFFNRIHYPTGAYGIILNDRKDYLEDVFDHFYIKHSLDLPNNSKLNLNISYLDYYQYGRYPTSGNSLFINVDNFSNKIFSFDVNYSRETKINSFLIGLEYKSISYGLKNYDIDYFDESFIDIYLDLKKLSVPFYSLYFSYEHKFNYESEDKYWLFSFSCRYDDYTSLYGDFKSIIVPQLSLIRVEKSKALKLIYSQNYRPPSISESYYNDGGISEIANPNLAPEKHKTWHLIYYQELKRKNLKGYFSMGLYFTNINNLIDEVNIGTNNLGINVSQFQNVEDIEIVGGIMDYVIYFEDKEFFRISYSYSNARTLKNFSFLPNSPQNLFLLKYARRISQDLWISFENKYTSSVLDGYGIKVGEYSITNLNLVYELKEGNLTLSVHNIFDVKANNVISLASNYPVSVYPVKPRTMYLNLVRSF